MNADPDLNLPGVNADLAQVIAKLLSKTPEARYQHADEVQAALHTAMRQPVPSETSLIRESFLQAATFVGREAELTQLKEALVQTSAGQCPVWLLGGESGVGKTRLTDEVRIHAMLQGLTVLRGQGVEGGGLPYQLWREPVRRLLLMHPDIPDLQAGILKDIVPDISGLLDREVADTPKLEGQAYQQRLILTIVDLFRNLSKPVLLLLEDLQWTGESLTVLQQMLRVIEQLPNIMVLGNYRHDERPDLPDELPGSQVLILERLDDAEVAKLSQAMLGEAASSPHIVSLLTQETEGNTFFIVEVMRALAEEAGQLDDISTMTLPEGVFTGGMARLLQRRIQKVATSDQALLQLAAVAGRQLDGAVLRVLAPDMDITAWQQRVGDAAVLTVHNNQWEYAHDKLRETLLAELDGKKQREMHRQVAEALETVYPEDANYNEALLGHWHQAGDLDKEIQYLEPVAQHLIQIIGAHEQAHALLRRGLALLPPTDGRRVALLNRQAVSYWRQGDYAQCQELAWQAREFAVQLGDQRGIANSLNSLGLIAYFKGEYATARDYQQQSLAIGQAIDDQRGIASSLMHLGNIALHQNDDTAARDYQQQSLAIVQTLGDQRGIAASLGNLGMIVAGQGDYIAARDYHQRSLAIFQAIGDQQGIANSLSNLGFVAYDQGDYAAARDYHQQSLTIIQAIGDQWGIANALINLSFVHLHLRPEQARPSLHRALAIAQDLQAVPLILEAVVGFAGLYLQGTQAARAGELCGLVQHHPTFDSEVQIRLDEVLPLLQAALPPTKFQAALERGKALDLDTVVAELLEEFGEDSA
ncbi:MAG: tetratricopeptide repeat protein [Planctomycetes bacterium]|nr:tetratricopeptide repeat protein [Planctomycetota bacterium]